MPYFGRTSRQRLATCDERLQRVLTEAIAITDFAVLCGYRDEAAQQEAYDSGHSRLRFPQSRHNIQPSRAVDVAPYPIDWEDRERFCFLAGVILGIAHSQGIQIAWGGEWTTFPDLPHFELA